MKLMNLILFVVLSYCCRLAAEAVSCLDQNGNPIDWYIALKLHKDKDSDNKLIRDGVGHVYMDSKTSHWLLSNVSMNDSKQAIGFTLQQIYDNAQSEDVGYVMYNDEWPNNKRSNTKGHTKGTLGFDTSSGFWLIHSTPKFPEFAKNAYTWPDNALLYGQSFLCISFNFNQFELIGGQLLYNYPSVYDFNIPDKFKDNLQNLTAVVNGKHKDSSPWKQSVNLHSRNGITFKSYSKSTHFNKDIYASWLAPDLKTNLFAETWQNGANRLQSFCNGSFEVQNIRNISILGIMQKETTDHSKWAVSYSSTYEKNSSKHKWTDTKQITCIGGINRMESQMKRAGGVVCFEIPEVWEAFRQIIRDVEQCPT